MDILIQTAKETGQFEMLQDELMYTALNHTIIRWETKVVPEELEIKKEFLINLWNILRKIFLIIGSISCILKDIQIKIPNNILISVIGTADLRKI